MLLLPSPPPNPSSQPHQSLTLASYLETILNTGRIFINYDFFASLTSIQSTTAKRLARRRSIVPTLFPNFGLITYTKSKNLPTLTHA